MSLHPEERKRHFPEEAPVAWDPIRRDLEANKDWYRDLVEHSRDLLSVHDLEGRLLSVNPVPARLLGYSVEEMLRKRLRDVIDPRFQTKHDAYLREIARTGERHGLVAVLTRFGEQRIWEYHNTLRTEGVATPIVRGIAHDVTERVRAEHALRRTNQQLLRTARERERMLKELTLFRALLDQSNDAVQVIEPGTLRLLDVNERTCDALGYRREELLSMTICDIALAFDESSRLGISRQLEASGFATFEKALQRKNGTTFPVEVNLRRVRLDREYWVAVSRDITARKQTEEALRASEARERARAKELETVLDAVPVAVYMTHDADCQRMTGNRAAYEHMRLPAGVSFSMSVPAADSPSFRLIENGAEVPTDLLPMQQAAATGKPVYGRALTMVFEDGSEQEELVNAVPLLDDNGNPRGVVGASIDVTELKQAEKALRESELRFRTVYERAPLGIALMDSRSGRFLQVNPKFCEIAGRSEEELLRTDVRSITDPDDIVQTEEYLRLLAEEKLASYEMEKRYVRPDRSLCWVRVLVVPMWGTGETRRWQMGLVEDITERKEAEEAQRESERRQNQALQIGKMGAFEVNLENGRGRWTAELAEIWGIPDGFTGSLMAFCWERVHPADLARVKQEFGKLVQSRVEAEMEFRMIRPDGDMRWIRWRGLVLADKATGFLRATGVNMDITERKQSEGALRQSEERFRVALKNSPIAVFNQDRDLRYTWMYNPQLSLSAEEMLGKTPQEFVDPEQGKRIMEVRRRVLETGVGAHHDFEHTKDGSKHYFDVTIEPVLDSSGAVIGLTGASMDVTALRKATEELREAKKKLAEEKLYLEQEIDTELGFGEIIGQSKVLQALMESVGKVAASDATVLLLGETGTGKELVARAIHRLSRRANNSFIKLNCAAIPSGLLESELFGNEKGAFTGAVSRKIGRLELADQGTLFLDEIGEISLALQPKLLRVLQDQEFERLGGTHTLKVDFRLIAATNRDLGELLRQGEFRSDLYYRLNVFPVRVPPLRERREDIHLLVEHFVRKCSGRMNKSITSIPKKTMDALIGWEWPGNVRELENFIERSVILSHGSVLAAPLSELAPTSRENESTDETLARAEREHILRALRESHGQIGGPRGAAARLGLKRTTLQSKMKHFGIDRRSREQ